MKVHLLQIPPEGLHLEGEEDRDILELPADDPVQPAGMVRYALDVGQNADGVWATGTAGVDLHVQCVRCLEPFVYPVEVDDVALQVERPTTETVDLTPLLREDILLALPAYPRCDWSGERVCPRQFPTAEEVPAATADAAFGNEGDADANGPAASVSAAWSALDDLDLSRRRDSPPK